MKCVWEFSLALRNKKVAASDLSMEWIITALAIAVIFYFAKDGSSNRKK
jgi:hypothetical protein